ncbi:MAG: MaoC family dehydratase N-terminal domain-containing protein [Gammaproteobacteria bacterium]|nr:MaoC family dehydratase N-terminal domain-containing protein [Gammaproteobacteria bacterium]MDH3371850.1 MaoC family dehydratase N-terminal domain-containing protein [Gammaproteobacteria bacterium]MDH3407821.1 MaoC family dehydratase N-terminal domain-containing protein [Gammaproteobacteria bacterium]MDH3551587.1 MaoC family dehydratase N-terminal domain-containing protein [Gammaproteobacteria bacterium]
MKQRESSALAALEALIGRRYGPYLSWHPVTEPMIWQWVEAFEDRNPLYSDAEFARSRGYRNIVSPPAMVQGWCLPSISRRYPPGSAKDRPYAALDIATELGFPGNVAVSYDQKFLQPVTVGDDLHYFVEPVQVSEEKSTRLGTGHFITCLEEYRNQDDVVVYESRTTYFNFRAPDPQASTGTSNGRDPSAIPRPPENYGDEVTWQDRGSTIETGASIGELHVPITSSRIAVCALASRDWMPVHHSRESAMSQGQPDIFMNILTTGGFVGRFLTDWAGAGSTIIRVKFSLGVPNYPGDNMILAGRVESMGEQDGRAIASVSYQGQNQLGPHVTGTADVRLP